MKEIAVKKDNQQSAAHQYCGTGEAQGTLRTKEQGKLFVEGGWSESFRVKWLPKDIKDNKEKVILRGE